MKITVTQWDNVCSGQYPEFEDAYITEAFWSDSGSRLTESELEHVNDNMWEYTFVGDSPFESLILN